MIFISHRGNLYGPNPAVENNPIYIQSVLDAGFHVEIDVWEKGGDLWLGHDEPQYEIPDNFLSINSHRLWIHAKNVEALRKLSYQTNLVYFWHQEDDVTLTSNRRIWTYPGKPLVYDAIACMPEIAYDGNLWDCYAICSDLIVEYKRLYENRNTN